MTTEKLTRPEIVEGFTCKIKTGLGMMYLTVNEIDGKPIEVFATIGKSGQSLTAKIEAICRLISLALRYGIDVSEVIKQLDGIVGDHPMNYNGVLLQSIPDAIAHVLKEKYPQ